jgi:hypothetical protein
MVPFQNPDIYIGSLKIQEPITVLTDVFVACVCVLAFIKTKTKKSTKGIQLYRWFFLTTGISTLVSAIIGHAFLYQWGFSAKIYGWVTGIISVAFGQYAALYHTKETFGEKKFNALFWINAFEICLALILVFVIFSFVVVEVHSAIALVLGVTILEYVHYKKTNSTLSKHMMIGVGIAVLAVLCHVFKLAISVWFNHLDLSHVIIAIAVYVMYIGVYKQNKKTKEFNIQ